MRYVAENDDHQGDYQVSEASFDVEEGAEYWVKVTSFDGSSTGSYELSISSSAGEPDMGDMPTEEDLFPDEVALVSVDELEALAPSFGELLEITSLLPQIMTVLADHLDYSFNHSHIDGEDVYSKGLIRIDW